MNFKTFQDRIQRQQKGWSENIWAEKKNQNNKNQKISNKQFCLSFAGSYNEGQNKLGNWEDIQDSFDQLPQIKSNEDHKKNKKIFIQKNWDEKQYNSQINEKISYKIINCCVQVEEDEILNYVITWVFGLSHAALFKIIATVNRSFMVAKLKIVKKLAQQGIFIKKNKNDK